MNQLKSTAKIGIVTLGHKPYWGQFEGLEAELREKGKSFLEKVSAYAKVVDAGFVDTVEDAFSSVRLLKEQDVDFLFILLSTYVTSSLAAPFAVYLNTPVVLVALQPLHKLNYQNTTTYMQLANDDICALPEITGVMIRLNHPALDVITGNVNDKTVYDQIREWCLAAEAVSAFKYKTLGYLGHTYEGMYDMHTDPTAFTRTFKSHVKMLEMCELADYVDGATEAQVKAKIDEMKSIFTLASPSYDPLTKEIGDGDLKLAAKVAVGLDTLVEVNHLSGLAYYYKGEKNNYYQQIGANMIIGNSLLTSKGIPLAGEADLKTLASMIIMNRIGGGGSFAELHPCDYEDDIILIGHDGPHNINISDAKPIMRKLEKFHGKEGSGVSVEFSIKSGDISLLGIGLDRDGKFKFISAEGKSIKGPIPNTGNTNTRCKFNCSVDEFIRRWCMAGPTHHLSLGVGRYNSILQKAAAILNVESIVICSEG